MKFEVHKIILKLQRKKKKRKIAGFLNEDDEKA